MPRAKQKRGDEISGKVDVAARNAQRLADAHRELRADSSIQFDLTPAPGPPKPPDWLTSFFHWLGNALKPVGRLLRWIGHYMPDAPYARILLWALLIGVLLWLLWLLYLQFFPRHGLPKQPKGAVPDEDDVLPEAAVAHRWLQEADVLAAEGRYAEAVHHLLIRSIDDIGKRRPQLIRPALTSRDLAAAQQIPLVPRRLFADIAAVVERSLFGGRAVDNGDWTACRAAYDDFAKGREWRR